MASTARPNRLAKNAARPPAPAAICPTCRDKKYVVRPGDTWAQAQPCVTCSASCDICGGAGWTIGPDEGGALVSLPCACRIRQTRLARFNDARLPLRYAGAEIDTFLERQEPSLKAARLAVARLALRFSPGMRGVGLSGTVGVGKTHLLAALVREVTLLHGRTARFIEFSHLLSDLKAGFDSGRSELELLEPLVSVDLLVVDEVGKGLSTEWQLGVLDELVSRRYNLGRTICFSTNFPFGSTAAKRGREAFDVTSFEDRIGRRAASRLAEMCDWLTLSASDFRLTSEAREARP